MHTLSTIFEALPYILEGTAVTLVLVLGALFTGFLLGVPMAVARGYAPRPFKWLVAAYVWFFRGVPVLLLLFLFYYGLFGLIGLDIGTIGASCVVLGMTSAAYQSQIFRGSIQSLPAGQMKAGRALGMTDIQTIRTIILPQALRLSIPGWSNEYSILLKDSAMCFALGTPEIMARTHFVASRTYEHLPLYITAGLIYFAITMAGVAFLRHVERKTRIPGYNAAGM
ncbi:MAG: amino acid ABC transporter permease [Mailhella sp.]|nr:amino acid ABC transporter permease [Mailhella sp.]